MISLEDNFNQVSLHNPSKEILSVYEDIAEIQELDPRGQKKLEINRHGPEKYELIETKEGLSVKLKKVILTGIKNLYTQ